MSLNNIKGFLYNKLSLNKKMFYFWFISASIISFMQAYFIIPYIGDEWQCIQNTVIVFSFSPINFCLFTLIYLITERANTYTISNTTDNELKISFLLFVIYSLIIFSLPLLIIYYSCIKFGLYGFYKLSLITAVYFITTFFYFILDFLLVTIFINKINITVIILNIILLSLILVCFHLHLILNIVVNLGGIEFYNKFSSYTIFHNIINNNFPIKIDIAYQNAFFSTMTTLSYSFYIINFYLILIGIILIILLWYYFDSIRVSKYLRSYAIPILNDRSLDNKR